MKGEKPLGIPRSCPSTLLHPPYLDPITAPVGEGGSPEGGGRSQGSWTTLDGGIIHWGCREEPVRDV